MTKIFTTCQPEQVLAKKREQKTINFLFNLILPITALKAALKKSFR